jgi:2-(1,2-epoxy-1,2-dihydrophenyl)acetyl-CoA isomerase
MTFLLNEDRDRVRWLTLNAPERKNAVPREGWGEMIAAFEDFESSEQRVLVIRGAGEDFCAGADVGTGFATGAATTANVARMHQTGRAAMTLHEISKPVVAAVDGVAVGAGLNLALGCDVIVATDRARFSEIFVKRGLTLDFGGTWLLPRIVGLAKARDLALTGRIVAADEALQMGLIARVVAPEELESSVGQIADELASGAPLAQRFIKVGLDRSSAMTFEQALAFEELAQAILLGSEDLAEGAEAFLERRPPQFRGR